jgi:hypothetical protein
MKDANNNSTQRDVAGRYKAHERCEACRQRIAGEYVSDGETLAASAYGLLLCARVRCTAAREAMSVADRIAYYARPSAA